MANLMEAYKNRLAISESVYQRSHNGAKMSNQKKLMIASVLNNTSKFLNEAFSTEAATQKSMIGDWKKFCLNVSTTALPNLILPELMLTQPMTSLSGYVTYLKYTAGVNKGGVKQDDLFNSAYRLGKMDEDRANYTSNFVVEKADSASYVPAWNPVVGSIEVEETAGNWVAAVMSGTAVTNANGKRIRYVYNNVVIPQTSTPDSLPTLTANMSHIQLTAKARRIAVYYSQIAAFQAKTDYGFDLGEQLSAQAQGELAYEIDTEGVFMLNNAAETMADLAFPTYEVAINQGAHGTYISRSQYYEGFAEIIARGKRIIYTRTQKFAPNYMVVGANILTILPYLKGWNAAPAGTVNGPYYAGTVDGLKVYVSPSIGENRFFFGVNGSDLQTSAAVYAPYMAIVPTQLLGFADGGMSQGFSTMYDMKLLSTYNITSGAEGTNAAVREDAADDTIGKFSWLLCAGNLTDTLPTEEVGDLD